MSLWTNLRAMAAAALISGPALADPADVDRLYEVMRLDEVLAIMREEGLDYGESIARDVIGRSGADWTAAVDVIYEASRLEAALRAELHAELDAADLGPVNAFFAAEPGATLVDLEIAARRAMLNPDLRAAAEAAAAAAVADKAPRIALLDSYIAANDLIESNVMGALNANLAFFRGMADGGALNPGVTEAEILADVWLQEDGIRKNTGEWLYSYLLLAYSPASDADLETYVAFSETAAGQALNRGLFAAFDRILTGVSGDLGRAAARFVTTQEL